MRRMSGASRLGCDRNRVRVGLVIAFDPIVSPFVAVFFCIVVPRSGFIVYMGGDPLCHLLCATELNGMVLQHNIVL